MCLDLLFWFTFDRTSARCRLKYDFFLAACLVVREQDYPTGKSRYVLDCFAAIAMTESPE
jgi:hypothetical protein